MKRRPIGQGTRDFVILGTGEILLNRPGKRHPALPHPGNQKRQLPLQEQLSPSAAKTKGETQALDRSNRPETKLTGGSLLCGNQQLQNQLLKLIADNLQWQHQ